MATIGSINISLQAVTTKFDKGLADARKGLAGFASSVLSLKGLALGVGAGFAALGVGHLVGEAAREASDLNETLSKTDAVLGDAAPKVRAFADEMASKFGLIRRETLDAATAFGGLGKGLGGLSGGALSDFSIKFAGLAADLSSFANLDLKTATAALQTGLAGEQSDVLKKLGVILTETTVKAYAYSHGIAAYGKELTEAQKVQARAGIITEKLADAQGDLARTAGGVANQARAAQGRVTNLLADAGNAFSAITQSVLGGLGTALGKLGDAFGENSAAITEWAKGAVSEGGIISEGISYVGIALGGVADAAHFLGLAFTEGLQVVATTAVAYLLDGIVALGHGLESLLNLLPGVEVSFTDTLSTIAEDLHRLASDQAGKFVEDLAKPPPSEGIKRFFDDIKAGASNAAKAITSAGSATKDLGAGTSETAGKIQQLVAKLKEQVATFGLSSSAAELYKLAKEGATDADLAEARALSDELAGLEESKKIREEMSRDAEKYTEEARSPLEKFQDELDKLQQLFDAGQIDAEVFDRSVGKAFADLQKDGSGGERKRFAGALELGSKEARSAVLNFKSGGAAGDPLKAIEKTNREQLAEQRKQTAAALKVADALSNQPATVSI